MTDYEYVELDQDAAINGSPFDVDFERLSPEDQALYLDLRYPDWGGSMGEMDE